MNFKIIGLVTILVITITVILFFIYSSTNDNNNKQVPFEADKNLREIEISRSDYESLLYSSDEKAVVIFPLFTGFAYEKNGFYDYYNKKCDESCLTIKMNETLPLSYNSSQEAFMLLQLLKYPYLTDLDIEKNPSILKNYDKIILLHSEYVTRNEFLAITNHPKVIYLYPNALYAEVSYDKNLNMIKLIRGHGYHNSSINNGFNWENDNTRPFEYDTDCKDWKFYIIDNGHMLNCYPENVITKNLDIVRQLKEL